jgi:subtilisin family serine protease
MRRIIPFLGLVCLLNTGFLTTSAQAASPLNAASAQTVAIFVGLKGAPLAADPNMKASTGFTKWRRRLDPTLGPAKRYRASLTAYQNHEIAYLHGLGLQFHVDRQYNVLLNGFSAHAPLSQLIRLRSLSNVAGVTFQRHIRPLLDKSVDLVHAPQAWSQLGGGPNAGRGIMIADVDTGIDINSPCFSDKGFAPPPFGKHADTAANLKLTNNKVIVARAFGGDPSQKFNAVDSVGHGTFTAAIEACDYQTPTPLGTKISGMAPAAYLLNYNVFPQDECGGAQSVCSTILEDPALEGLQAAVLDGADVVNMSLGSDLGSGDLSLDPLSQAVDLSSRAGIPMVVSAGNAGPTLQSVSSPAVAPHAIAVGATTNSRVVVSSTVTVTGPQPVPASLAKIPASQGTRAWTGPIGPNQMVFVGLGRRPKDDTDNPNADDFAGKDLHGKIALIQRGTLTFETKLNNAKAAGAVAAIIFDNLDELSFSGDVRSATLPSAFISKSAGQTMLNFLQSHADATVQMDSDLNVYDETPNILASFSSRGFGPDYTIKPDLVAPGQDIYSATESSIPNSELYNASGFASADGTSFSAPHVAGAVALLLQKHPKWTPDTVKSVLVQTTDRVVKESLSDQSEPPITEQGSGLLDVNNAVAATAYLSPPSLTFGQVNTALTTSPLNGNLLLNSAGSSGDWQISVEPVEGAGSAKISVPSHVQLPSGGNVNVPVQITPSASAPAGNVDGFVTLTHGGQSLHVSYFLRAVHQPITAGSVFLLDATGSRFQSPPSKDPVKHVSVDQYFRDAVTSIGKSYTYWNDAKLGPPTLADLKPAQAVIVFTGANLNGFAKQNDNPQALEGALGSLDVTAIRQYLDTGGRVFLTGLTVDISDPYWAIYLLGSDLHQLSAYDNASNDKKKVGGISPPQPSTKIPDLPQNVKNTYLFSGMKPIDFSNKGDGVGDNIGTFSQSVETDFGDGFVGVTGMAPISGCDSLRCAYGQAVLQVPDTGLGGPDVGIVSSNEPTLASKATYAGRSVFFSFDFAGINDNTGFATRSQVLKRIFDWFDDKPTVTVKTSSVAARSRIRLAASFHGLKGVHVVQYQWQVGTKTLKASKTSPLYTFPHAGTFKTRVEVIDSLGHHAVSTSKVIRAR